MTVFLGDLHRHTYVTPFEADSGISLWASGDQEERVMSISSEQGSRRVCVKSWSQVKDQPGGSVSCEGIEREEESWDLGDEENTILDGQSSLDITRGIRSQSIHEVFGSISDQIQRGHSDENKKITYLFRHEVSTHICPWTLSDLPRICRLDGGGFYIWRCQVLNSIISCFLQMKLNGDSNVL